MVHIKYRNMKCNYHNAVRKEFWRKYIIVQTLFGKNQDYLDVIIYNRRPTQKGLKYTMTRSYFLVGMDQLGKPFWERKMTGENQAREDVHWNAFVEEWNYLIT